MNAIEPVKSRELAGYRPWLGAAIAATVLALGLNSLAVAQNVQTAQAGASAGPQAGNELEEIVVTATRRSESLSKVPISVMALSQDDMDDRGIKDFQDIARFTPGVSIDNTGTNAISIRGISSSGGAGTTGIYLDDTPIQMRAVGFNPDDTLPKTFDLDRVEILRGPQGTLFGAGSEGGTVRYIMTQAPLTGSSTYARGELSFTEGGQPSYELGVAHGMSVVDDVFGIRASAWARYDGGWIDRVDPTTGDVTEKNANYADALNLRLAAIWKPGSAVVVTPSIVYQKNQKHDEDDYWPAYSNPSDGVFHNATPERMPVPDQYTLPQMKIDITLQNSEIISNSSYYNRKEQTAYQGTAYDLIYYESLPWSTNQNTLGIACPDTGLVPTGAPLTAGETINPPCSWYPLLDVNGIHLPAGLPASVYQYYEDNGTPNVITNHQTSWTQEVRWQSTNDSSKWRWTVGAFWQLSKEGSIEELKDAEINQLFNYLFGEDAYTLYGYGDPTAGNFYSCPGYPTPAGQPVYTAIPACDIYYNNNKTTDRQIAAFGEIGYSFTDKLRLTLGERIARTSFTISHYADGFENYGPETAGAAQSETPNTPKVNLSYQMDNTDLFYATYAKGFREGGGNPPLPSYCGTPAVPGNLQQLGFATAPLTYNSDSTQSYEIGSKNSFGSWFKIATSVYYIQWHNIQQNVYVAGACGLQFTDNLGTAVAKGADVQIEMAAGHWKFDVSAGYTDARYTAGAYPPCYYDPTPCQQPAGTIFKPLSNVGDAISGEAATEYAPGLNPPWTAAIGGEFDFKAGDHPAFVRADFEFEARNNWLSVLQDPSDAQFNPLGSSTTVSNTYTLPSTFFGSVRGGVTLNSWQLALFVDNVFDSHTETNYQLSQPDSYNPNGLADQQNAYTFRPRTFGITATLHL
jgi:iron complex outermembrane recepter protein